MNFLILQEKHNIHSLSVEIQCFGLNVKQARKLTKGQILAVSKTCMNEYYTITDFCRSEYEFLLTCKIILTEAKYKSIKSTCSNTCILKFYYLFQVLLMCKCGNKEAKVPCLSGASIAQDTAEYQK